MLIQFSNCLPRSPADGAQNPNVFGFTASHTPLTPQHHAGCRQPATADGHGTGALHQLPSRGTPACRRMRQAHTIPAQAPESFRSAGPKCNRARAAVSRKAMPERLEGSMPARTNSVQGLGTLQQARANSTKPP